MGRLLKGLLNLLSLGLLFGGSAEARERYVGSEKFAVDRERRPFDLYPFEAWITDLSARGLVVDCHDRDDCALNADDVRAFQQALDDPDIASMDLQHAAIAAAIYIVLGSDRRFPVDILVDPSAA